MEACLFKCQVCWDYDTTVGEEFSEHISSRHQMAEVEYEETFESLMFAPSHVECPRCEGSVLHCEKDISEHQVSHKHSLQNNKLLLWLGLVDALLLCYYWHNLHST